MEPKRGSVCVVARLTNRVSLHLETDLHYTRTQQSVQPVFV